MSHNRINSNRWVVIAENYQGLIRKGLGYINKAVMDLYQDYLSVYTMDDMEEGILESCNLIIVGQNDCPLIRELIEKKEITPCQKAQGYTARIADSVWNPEKQMVVIAGADTYGTLYGCVDFVNQYCGVLVYRSELVVDDMHKAYFEVPFKEKIPEWNVTTAPAVAERGIWTWGHVIYDYRQFFENMLKLKMNEVVIWNDFAPINAKDIADYAHDLGIKLVWGFPWGWGTDCNTSAKLDDESLKQLGLDIVAKYEREYAHSGCDGIYFQSFTELSSAYIGDKLIAETVVDFVNYTAGMLLEKYPNLHIQFGLHAGSVMNHTQYIAKVDPRIYIIWENCGSFPFQAFTAYRGDENNAGDLPATKEFVEKISVLRGKDDKFGAVLKGMLALDWGQFQHQTPGLIMGERSQRFLRQMTEDKNRIWKTRQSYWIRHVEYLREVVLSLIKDKDYVNVQELVEKGMFETTIALPVAIYAETLWNPEKPGMETVLDVMKYPCVQMANL